MNKIDEASQHIKDIINSYLDLDNESFSFEKHHNDLEEKIINKFNSLSPDENELKQLKIPDIKLNE